MTGLPATGYDPVTRLLHWLNAVLALIVVLLAFGIAGQPRHSDARHWLLVLHVSFGLLVLVLLLFWAGWRLRHAPPPLRPVLSLIETLLARTTHAALFVLLAGMPLSGYVTLAAAGRQISFFGIAAIPPLVPASGRLAQAAIALHLGGEFLIYALVAMHIGAALLHGFIRRDGILERMLPRRGA